MAWQQLRESLAANRQIDDLRGVAGCLAALASLALSLERPALAARLCGAVKAMLRQANAPALNPGDRFLHERTQAAVRATIGESAYAASVGEGRTRPLDDTIAEVSVRLDELM